MTITLATETWMKPQSRNVPAAPVATTMNFTTAPLLDDHDIGDVHHLGSPGSDLSAEVVLRHLFLLDEVSLQSRCPAPDGASRA